MTLLTILAWWVAASIFAAPIIAHVLYRVVSR